MKTWMFRNLICVLLFAGADGCVMYQPAKDSPRAAIAFQSVASAQTFYEAYTSRNYTVSASGTVDIYLPLPYWERDRKSDNVRFDDAIVAADTDHDGIISDDEARDYSDKVHGGVSHNVPVAITKGFLWDGVQ